jgi:carbon monoxide dehydrogenase subunit G
MLQTKFKTDEVMGHVSYSEKIDATPEQVWAILSDVTRLPDWAYTKGRFPHPVEGRYGSEQREGPGTIWIGTSDDGQTAIQKITVWDPPQKLVYQLQETEHAPLQMSQTNTFDLEPDGDSTKVTWSVDWELTGGFSLNTILIRFSANGAFEEMIAGSLENLKHLVEEEALDADAASSKTDEDASTDTSREIKTE